MWELVRQSGTLDLNSPYVYLMACLNFTDTCVIAEAEGALAGMVMAYRQPAAPQVLFVWQVGVAQAFRGRGIGRAMLRHLVTRVTPAVTHVETTITPSNQASQALFRGFARDLGATVAEAEWLSKDVFPRPHEAEELFRIGPFQRKG